MNDKVINVIKDFTLLGNTISNQVMRNYNIDSNIIDVIMALYDDSKSAVLLNNQIGEFFRSTVGVHQGCPLSPVLFDIYLENIMTEALSGFQPSISINGRSVCNLRFADDIDLTAGTEKELEDLITRLETRSKAFGMEVSDEKTKTLLVTCTTREKKILDHCYTTIAGAYRSLTRAPLGRSDHATVFLVPVYRQRVKTIKPVKKQVRKWDEQSMMQLQGCLDCTDWTVFKDASANINEYTDTVTSEHKTNEYVRQRIDTLAGKQEPLLSVVKRRKLTWFGHVNRHYSLAKAILQGTVEGGHQEDDNARHGLTMPKSGRERPSTLCYEYQRIETDGEP
ncbi:hypothetical protein ACOMHN_007079 [Nucella lapillus]